MLTDTLKLAIHQIDAELAQLTKTRETVAATLELFEGRKPVPVTSTAPKKTRKRRTRTPAERADLSRRLKAKWAERKLEKVAKAAAQIMTEGHVDAPPTFTQKRRELREQGYAE